jgi:2,5-diketo-D-gluconate reductase A
MTTKTTPRTLTLNNGVAMPVLGLGVFQSPPEETTAAVETAIADGYRLIDTAASYDNEREVGAAIRASGIDRTEIFVTTKLWISDCGYDEALVGFEGCLLRWHNEHGVVAIPKSVKPHRIDENIDVFDFELTADEVAAIDALDTGVRGGPDPEAINMTTYPKKVEND